MARRYRMHGLEGIKEDAMELLSVGGGAVVGIAAAKMVTTKLEEMEWAKPGADGAAKAWVPYVSAAVPLAVGAGIIYASNKAGLEGNARKAAVGVAAGMAAVSIGKIVTALAPEAAKSVGIAGLGAMVDTYDSGLLAGLGEFDASVAAYMRQPMFAGSPTQVQQLMGAPVQVQAFAGAPTQVQTLSGAPMSATLM